MNTYQKYILELVDQLQSQVAVIAKAKEPLAVAQTETNRLRKIVDQEEEKLAEIQEAIAGAREGVPLQKKLFGAQADADKKARGRKGSKDSAGSTPIVELGLTEVMVEKMEAAELKTVGDLEKAMREDPHWYRKIKGFGQAGVDKLTDQLLAWRLKNPVPEETPPAAHESNGKAEANGAQATETRPKAADTAPSENGAPAETDTGKKSKKSKPAKKATSKK